MVSRTHNENKFHNQSTKHKLKTKKIKFQLGVSMLFCAPSLLSSFSEEQSMVFKVLVKIMEINHDMSI
jgi:hypothetical protein